MLTVRENLRFSAELRLPSSLSRREKHARVEEVIEELQLTKCADSFIGSALVRGISGGEGRRKRVVALVSVSACSKHGREWR